MIKKKRFSRIFFGWWTVLAGGFLGLWVAGYSIYGFSALFKPIASEFGFSRAVTASATSIGRLLGGFQSPVTGWISDRFGSKSILMVGAFLFGLGLILMNFINSLWAFYAVWGILVGIGANITMNLPIDKTITNWFVKKRGIAISTKWTLAGLGGVVVLPLVVAPILATEGWRIACVTGGLVMWFAGLPLIWFLVKQRRPEFYGLLPDGAYTETEPATDTARTIDRGIKYAAEVQEIEFTLRQAMRTPAYWLLIVAQVGYGAASSSLITHFIPFVTDMGINPVRAAVMLGIMSFTAIPTRLIAGLIVDRLKKGHLRFLLGVAYLIQAIGISSFLLNQTIATVYVFYILYYFGFGISLPLISIIRGRYFGRKGFGSIQGTSMMFMTPVQVVAPIYLGWVYDTSGSYTTAFALIAGLLAFSSVIMSLIFPPKPPARVTDIGDIV